MSMEAVSYTHLISILLVTVLFLLTIQPAFATGNQRKIDDYSIEELLNLSVQEQELSLIHI